VKGVSLGSAQGAHDRHDIIVLKEANGSDSGCSGAPAGLRILDRNPSEGENRNSSTAGPAETVEALRAGSRRIFFFEDGSEQGQVRRLGGGLDDFFRRVARDRDQRAWQRAFTESLP
jgi:hypothetical protein